MTEYEEKKNQLEQLLEAWQYLTPDQAKAHTDMIVGTAGVNRILAMRAASGRNMTDGQRTA